MFLIVIITNEQIYKIHFRLSIITFLILDIFIYRKQLLKENHIINYTVERLILKCVAEV